MRHFLFERSVYDLQNILYQTLVQVSLCGGYKSKDTFLSSYYVTKSKTSETCFQVSDC